MTSLITRIEDILDGHTAQAIEHFVVSLGSASLKIAATSPLGMAVLAAIKAGEAGTNPVEKIGLAIESLTPTIAKYATDGGLAALESDIETVARTLIEGVLAQVKTTGPLTIIETLEKILLNKGA